MDQKVRILLMHATEYEFKADDGRSMRGCSLTYYFWGEHGEGLKSMTTTEGAIGYQRGKNSTEYDVRDHVICAPAIYDASFAMKVGSDGKVVLKLTDLDYVSDVRFIMADDPALNKKAS